MAREAELAIVLDVVLPKYGNCLKNLARWKMLEVIGLDLWGRRSMSWIGLEFNENWKIAFLKALQTDKDFRTKVLGMLFMDISDELTDAGKSQGVN